MRKIFLLSLILALFSSGTACSQSADPSEKNELDHRVMAFLEKHRNSWFDLNVPYEDGEVLYQLILRHQYTNALEIGTSTGHSTIWIAWAMSKTGGKVTTIEIDKDRHQEALENLREAGLIDYVDARLGDAHKLVKELEGPFDFVFSDADKGWYTQYFRDVEPKLEIGGCYTAHNVSNTYGGTKAFMDYVTSQDNFETSVNRSSRSGISISYKRSE